MHAIQTSGNCVAHITSDEFAGIAPDENRRSADRCAKSCAMSTFHRSSVSCRASSRSPVNGSVEDRSATAFHDIGLSCGARRDGELGLRVLVGGAWAAPPVVGTVIRDFRVAAHDDLRRVHPARLQPLRAPRQHLQGAHQDPGESPRCRGFARQVEEEWALVKNGPGTLTEEELKPRLCIFHRAGLPAAAGG